jgi:O-antigen/teichoic acid export membrane protein
LNIYSSSFKYIILLFCRLITVIFGLVFVPIYVKLLGAESFGLVAFFTTLTASLAILDMGLGTAISRQISVLNSQPNNKQSIIDLVYSVEIIYWVISLVIGIAIISLSSIIAKDWLIANTLPTNTIYKSIVLMGCVFAFSFPLSIYTGVLNSLEFQISNAIILLITTILRTLGVIFVLNYISPTIEIFFIWQLFISICTIFSIRIYLWSLLNKSNAKTKPKFSKIQLQNIYHFAAGMAGISFITFFLSQFDKIIVSKYLTLDYVGYYGLAFTVGGAITQVITPLYPIVFPRFSALITNNRQEELIELYHKCCKWISIIVMPIGLTMILFSKDILLLWTHNEKLSSITSPILQIITAGTICNSLIWVPYWYQLAKGITKFTLYQNLIASIILIPLLFWWVNAYGALGASYVWLAVNAGYVVFSIPIFHTKYMKGQLKIWYLNDNLYSIIISSFIVSLLKYFQLKYVSVLNIFNFGILLLIAVILYSFLIPEIRKTFFKSKIWRIV